MEDKNSTYLSAQAIMKAFKLSGKKHLFITGSRGVGKSTVAKAIMESITDETIRHIFSYAVARKGVYVRDNKDLPKTQIGQYCESQADTDTTKVECLMKPLEDGFYSLIDDCLNNVDEQWVILDEIGYLEAECNEYLFKLNQMLKERRFIAVVRKQELPHLKRFLRNPDAFVIDLDKPTDKIGAIVLALEAGDKAQCLAPLAGKPVIKYVLDKTGGLVDELVVATNNKDLADYCNKEGLECIYHPSLNKTTGIKIGLEKLKNTKASLVVSASEPMLTRTTLENLAFSANYNPFQIWRVFFGDKVSEALAIPGRLYEDMILLPEGKGINYLIKNNQDKLLFIEAFHKMELTKLENDESYQLIKTILENNLF